MLKLALVIVGLLVAAAIAWTLASATTTTASGTRKPRCPLSTDRWPPCEESPGIKQAAAPPPARRPLSAWAFEEGGPPLTRRTPFLD
jgi:hypothetical protein